MKYLKLISLILSSLGIFYGNSLNAQTTTFNYTGAVQTYVVPVGVVELSIDALGAEGGDGGDGIKPGGTGGRVQTTLAVTPGQTLYIYVGGTGFSPSTYTTSPISGGFNGGGTSYQWAGSGGGASDIRIGGTTLADRVIVSGGGGGAGDNYPTGDKGGNGGGLIGANGEHEYDPNDVATGKGGTQVAGGIAGDHPSLPPGTDGTFGIGGDGCTTFSGAGGGGGYYGGGGGSAAGAGGGSSYTDPALTTGTIHTQGYNSGDGQIIITEICNSGSPIPDNSSLSDLVGECSVSAPTPPTATNCSGTFNGSSNVTFPITAQGTTTVTWTYDDGSGNTSTQTQDVIITDATAPVADIASLQDVTDECSVTSLTPPTATDNCEGTITGTPDVSLPITTQGTTTVTWTYDDGNGNSSTQTQDVIITDATAPVADIATLQDVTDECSVTSLTPPTATDNCEGTITGTPDVSLPITTQGTTTVTWTYDDGNGNSSTQTQDVIITDATAPVADIATLQDVTDECSVSSITSPTATDNCEGTITGIPDVSFPISAQGTTTVTWTYDDGNGNISTQTQDVIITPIDNSITQVDPVTLSADASGYNYQWVDCDNGNSPIAGANNQSFTPSTAGSYACEIDNGTCSVITPCLTSTVGIIENNFESSISVFPNPTFGELSVDFGKQYSNIKISLFNSIGQKMLDKTVSNSDLIELNIEGQSGLYILTIQTESGDSAEIKIIKK